MTLNAVTQALKSVNDVSTSPQKNFAVDPKAKNDRFTLIDKPAQPHGCTYLLDMVSALKEFKATIKKEDFSKYPDQKSVVDAYLILKTRVIHMNQAIDSSPWYKRIWLAVVQLFTFKSLNCTWKEIEKTLIPAKIQRDTCLSFRQPKAVYGDKKLIQPDDVKISQEIHDFNKKMASFIVEFNNKKATANIWQDAAFTATFDDLWKSSVALTNHILDLDFDCTYINWKEQKVKNAKDQKERDEAQKLTQYDMLASGETYLTIALKDLAEVYRYARFAVSNLDKGALDFVYATDTVKEDDYLKLFFDNKSAQSGWKTDYNNYIDRLDKILKGIAFDKSVKNFWTTSLIKDTETLGFKDYFDAFAVTKPAKP